MPWCSAGREPADGSDRKRQSSAGKRQAAGQCLVEHDPDAVPIARGRERLAGRLLGRHVGERASHDSTRALVQSRRAEVGGEPEVEQDGAAVAPDEHVGRFDVAVQLPRRVQGREAFAELPQRAPKPLDLGRRQVRERGNADRRTRSFPRATAGLRSSTAATSVGRRGPVLSEADEAQEIDAFDQLHREEPDPAVPDQLVQRDEIGMREVRGRAKLLLEEVERGRVKPLHGLERDDFTAVAVVGPIDDAHPALAQLAQKLEVGRLWCQSLGTRLATAWLGPSIRAPCGPGQTSASSPAARQSVSKSLHELGAVVAEFLGRCIVPIFYELFPAHDQIA